MSYIKHWQIGPRQRVEWTASSHVDGGGHYALQYLLGYKLFGKRFRLWTTVTSVPEWLYQTDPDGLKALAFVHKNRKTKYNAPTLQQEWPDLLGSAGDRTARSICSDFGFGTQYFSKGAELSVLDASS